MLVGDPEEFAVESLISKACERLSFRGLGFFAIHIKNTTFGIREPDATMLACSLDEVNRRIAARGQHRVSFCAEPDAAQIARVFHQSQYGAACAPDHYFGLSACEFEEQVTAGKIVWAPDGDEAFDDGSYVLQFDVGNKVRLIGFRSAEQVHGDISSLADIWMEADNYYDVLREWQRSFLLEWQEMPKEADE